MTRNLFRLLGLQLADVEVELLALEDVAIAAAGLTLIKLNI